MDSANQVLHSTLHQHFILSIKHVEVQNSAIFDALQFHDFFKEKILWKKSCTTAIYIFIV